MYQQPGKKSKGAGYQTWVVKAVMDDYLKIMKRLCVSCWRHPAIERMPSRIHAQGLFATRPLDAGVRVLVWGDCYTDRAGALEARQNGLAIMQWDDDVFSYETPNADPAFSINHSCDPNVWMEDAFTLTARRKISAGEELTTDYGLWLADPEYIAPWICRCGTACCRRRLTGRDWQIPELQERYAGHFSPLLNTWITVKNGNGNEIRPGETPPQVESFEGV